jgi:hypothetical protein
MMNFNTARSWNIPVPELFGAVLPKQISTKIVRNYLSPNTQN